MSTLRLHQLNDVKLVGRLTRDPELRFTAKGLAVCRFDIAVNRRYKDVTGEWKDDTSFVPVVVWKETAQRCADRLKKGSPVYVEGRLKSRNWETKDGQKRTSLEVNALRVQFLAKVEGEPDHDETAGEPVAAAVPAPGNGSPAAEEAADDDIPF